MVKSLLVTAALVASASAFAPAAKEATRPSSLNEFANGYVGGEGPEPMIWGGNAVEWDPLGLAEVCTEKYLS